MFVFSVAPMKALCSERYDDWSKKFNPVGLTCKELTGDSETDDYVELQKANIVMTTPVCIQNKRASEQTTLSQRCIFVGRDVDIDVVSTWFYKRYLNVDQSKLFSR